ncbi:uncharacterized protein LOC116109778 [Pistacia vera]|uniref:uncharacterized protein LOC116109778 n=1 Tax=Pistacia vera TaxID=55513 RepID=UPI001263816C|nr:uncharacterized protein LOC116109778 [Pistacia vera]
MGIHEVDAYTTMSPQLTALQKQLGVLEGVEQKRKDENPPSKAKEEFDEEFKEEVMVEKKPTSPREEESRREERPNQKKEKLPFPEIPPELAHHTPLVPFLQRLRKKNQHKQFTKFLKMPSYAKLIKEIMSNKRKLEEEETMMLTEECSAILHKKLPSKLKDLGRIGEVNPTTISLQLADRSIKHLRSIVEDVLVKVDKVIFPVDFVILDMEEDKEMPLILGRPFLATGRALIDVLEGKLLLRVQDEKVTFNVFELFVLI